jgi:hypothetical protein
MRASLRDPSIRPEKVITVRWIIIVCCACFVVLGSCTTKKETIVAPASLSSDTREAIVRGNCAILRDAIEAFAAESEGHHPRNLMIDTSGVGKTLIEYLPGGHMMLNPFTDRESEPVMGTAANPGEIGYALLDGCLDWEYFITGFGSDAVIVSYSNEEALEDSVRANCLRVQIAAERFAALNDGIYASDVDTDSTPGGQTITDLLPGGVLLMNPFTRAHTEPINGTAACPGETGYVPVSENGVNVGYTITGVGAEPGVVIITMGYPH